jgi:cell shape-determining protein MreC
LRLPSKIQSKNIALIVLLVLLILFPLRIFIGNTLLFFSRQLFITTQSFNRKALNVERKNLALTLALRELLCLKNENDKLRAALQLKTENNVELIGAEIIAFDPSSWRKFAVLNAGQDKGVKKGAYVIDERGYLLGKIITVKSKYSYLMLIDDPDFSLTVFIGEKALGMLKGTLGAVAIFYIEEEDKVKVKDKVWAKIPNVAFPIYIGEIRRINKDPNGLFLDIDVALFSREPLLHKIFIIK